MLLMAEQIPFLLILQSVTTPIVVVEIMGLRMSKLVVKTKLFLTSPGIKVWERVVQ